MSESIKRIGDIVGGDKVETLSAGHDLIGRDKTTINLSLNITTETLNGVFGEKLYQLLRDNSPKFDGITELNKQARTESFLKSLSNKAIKFFNTKNKIQKLLESLTDLDVSYVLNKAISTNARKGEEHYREILSSLIVERLKNKDIDFKAIIYNQAIEVMETLTTDHLKAITCSWLITKVKLQNTNNWRQLFKNLSEELAPFINFNWTQTEILYLNNSACGNHQLCSTSLFQHLMRNYRFLEYDEVPYNIYDSINVSLQIKEAIFTDLGNGYYAVVPNKLEEIKSTLSTSDQAALHNFTYNVRGADSLHFYTILKKEVPHSCWEPLLKLFNYETGVLNWFELSPVGEVIAQSYYEIVTEKPCNYDIFS